jgi:hypothetical protein
MFQWKDKPWVRYWRPEIGHEWKHFFLEKVNLLFLLNEQEAAKLGWAGMLGVFMSQKSRERRLLTNH